MSFLQHLRFIYHEMIAHVPVAYIPNASDVLIIGGGDGGTAKQLLQHPVQSITVVDLDKAMESLQQYIYCKISET